MPSITTIHDSLPYIDPEPTPAERAAAEALISAERAQVPDDPHHALLPPILTPTFTPAMAAELERVAADPRRPLRGIDLTRYEAQDGGAPPSSNPDDLGTALSRAYASATYLRSRRAHLALLDSYGKNAWLVGNYGLEAELKALERELAEAKREIDIVALRRSRAQEEVSGEVKGLEETWKRGVGRVLETEVATEALRREVLEAKRQMA